ncbi:two component transcriptional regulator, LuxR family [Streptoalloteichus tenebrarius]|uniref:Two component transcriptional regulator, LuxR family n=1 Tax=Streptoalloteichus tenebrarius (strain ATCC 17920 / DSM 40477 / JCM 4838 / CBS 697.72 / NBRC 16177 / NCIMB 11028 / NRRL B-12390 / A12253. 1 / ISP 5477) TaxID=1933 RepID=A0ABT1HQC4_STRSD|nr:response regulator transcription factor [Streptoalloteichus tenebrarius]MCP2257717.1 two component transcriptional regulator, LuxR family [Streptoalloteichus tenebrarius]BFE99929.1 response regulator transcription factor [Streptoalloteichus tenebrarius]
MIDVLLAEDHEMVREALASLLDLEPDLRVVGSAGCGAEALAMAGRLRPDVAVLDVAMPAPDGIEVVERLPRVAPDCRAVLVTGHGRPGQVRRALRAGAHGFLRKESPAAALAHAIRVVHGGRTWVEPELLADTLGSERCPLTPRELEALRLAADAESVTAIARRMGLSVGTVRNHLSSAIGKLGAANRHVAVRIATDRGWL